jgi:dienelactone hydrolase
MFHPASLIRRLAAVPVLLASFTALTATPARAQLRMEVIPFESVTLTGQQILLGESKGAPATIAGELRLPRGGTDRVPVVVLVHGIGGLMMNVDEWARTLNSWGFGAFILDNLSGRGITGMTPDDFRLSELARTVDVFRALARLAAHPRIDPERIAVMGFSRGATAILLSSVDRFRKQHGPADAQFAAYIALYPGCSTRYRDDAKVAARPIRVFHGTGDDWTPVEPCRALVFDMKKAGADVTLTEFAGATHAYDLSAVRERMMLPQAPSLRKCSLAEGEGGQLVNVKTGQAYSTSDPCIEWGVSLLHDEAATIRTRDSVKAVLNSAFAVKAAPPASGGGP